MPLIRSAAYTASGAVNTNVVTIVGMTAATLGTVRPGMLIYFGSYRRPVVPAYIVTSVDTAALTITLDDTLAVAQANANFVIDKGSSDGSTVGNILDDLAKITSATGGFFGSLPGAASAQYFVNKLNVGAISRLTWQVAKQDQFALEQRTGPAAEEFAIRATTDAGATFADALVIDRNTGGVRFRASGTTVASAATVDLGAQPSLKVEITGTTAITSLGAAPNSLRLVKFAGALVLTYNATSLVLPGGANLTTSAGDHAIFTSDALGNWTCRHYQRASAAGARADLGSAASGANADITSLGNAVTLGGGATVPSGKTLSMAGTMKMGANSYIEGMLTNNVWVASSDSAPGNSSIQFWGSTSTNPGLMALNATNLSFSTLSGSFLLSSSGRMLVGSGVTPGRQLHVYGAGQNGGAYNPGASSNGDVYVQDSGTAPLAGGGILFGAGQGPFAAIKSQLTNGSGPQGQLSIMQRIGAGDAQLTSSWAFVTSGHFYPGADSTYDFGGGGNRVRQIYAANGAISTSDERLKTPVRPFTEAELSWSRELAKLIGIYQFLDSVAAKGVEGARLRAGMTVQAAIKAGVDLGLDPTRYGFVCHDAWPEQPAVPDTPATEAIPAVWSEEVWSDEILDDDGSVVSSKMLIKPAEIIKFAVEAVPAQAGTPAKPAGDLYSFRIDELHAFMIACQEARLVAIEARLAAA